MMVTGETLRGSEANLRQVERLLASNLLHGSESLCKLLRFLAEQAISHPDVPVKEYRIATEVFGRPADFDPRLDSTVRVQTGRLRSKLIEYYASAGAEDSLVIEMPKGAYAVTFHTRSAPPVAPLSVSNELRSAQPLEALLPPGPPPNGASLVSKATEQPREGKSRTGSRALVVSLLGLSVALISAVLVIAYLAVALSPKASFRTSAPGQDVMPFRHLWKEFIDTSDQPWVVFSNAEFVGRPETGMKYFDALSDSKEDILDHYTGVGEVIGIHELDRVFEALHHGLRVKRGRLLSLDDAKNNDLIFVGSPSENLALREIPSTQDFVFKRLDTATRKGDLAIVNMHPKGDEPKIFYASRSIPLAEDYSLVALVPGMNPAHWVMLLAGTTTIGTEAAVEYVCRGKNISELLEHLTGSSARDVIPFEAVLHVKISHGVPVQSQLMAVHAR